jgi:hypothetical protein
LAIRRDPAPWQFFAQALNCQAELAPQTMRGSNRRDEGCSPMAAGSWLRIVQRSDVLRHRSRFEGYFFVSWSERPARNRQTLSDVAEFGGRQAFHVNELEAPEHRGPVLSYRFL